MSISFGPAGLGGVKEAIGNLEKYHELGLKACEIAFTYWVYIKNKEDALRIGKKAKELGISLSIHAPYYVNLNSAEKAKTEQSKKRILDCCEIGELLGAKRVIFHPGYYGIKRTPGSSYDISSKIGSRLIKEETFENIKKEILEMQEHLKKNKLKIKLAPETTGKINVFGSVDEIKKLTEETGCDFCIDFAHILAREKDYKFNETFKKFEKHKEIHIHFSGIEYGEKGEKNHKKTPEEELKKLIKHLPKEKDIIIINESPNPVADSVAGLKIFQMQ